MPKHLVSVRDTINDAPQTILSRPGGQPIPLKEPSPQPVGLFGSAAR